jgi:hypothetical protein
MGKIKQGILGNVSGKVGNVIGGSWKGIGTVRIMPSSVSNPQTAGQVEQRARMSGCVAFAQSLLSIWIKPLWDRFAVKQSGFNAFIQSNIALFVEGTLTRVSELVMSIGNMAATEIDDFSGKATDMALGVSWLADTVGFHLASDVSYVVVYDSDGNLLGFANSESRQNLTQMVSLSRALILNEVVYVFLVFKRTNGLYVSLASNGGYEVPAS